MMKVRIYPGRLHSSYHGPSSVALCSPLSDRDFFFISQGTGCTLDRLLPVSLRGHLVLYYDIYPLENYTVVTTTYHPLTLYMGL